MVPGAQGCGRYSPGAVVVGSVIDNAWASTKGDVAPSAYVDVSPAITSGHASSAGVAPVPRAALRCTAKVKKRCALSPVDNLVALSHHEDDHE